MSGTVLPGRLLHKLQAAVLVLLPGLVFANSGEPASKDTLRVNVEIVNLASNDPALTRLDVYLRVLYDNLQFIKAESDRFTATYTTKIMLHNAGGDEVASENFKEEVELASLAEADDRNNFKLSHFTFELPAGEYQVSMSIEDLETQTSVAIQRQVSLQDFPADKLLASDVLFLDDVKKDETGAVVWQPRVSDLQNEMARLLMYFEVYNVAKGDSFTVQYQVKTPRDSVVLSYEYREAGSGRVTQNVVDIEGEQLAHGRYVTNVLVTKGTESVELDKPFDWFLEGLPLEFADINKALEVLLYVASDQEYETLLALEGKDQYEGFVAFWKKHDPTPMTSGNHLRDEYYERVSFANRNFGTVRKEGWRTDRGWAYVLLGPPDTINSDSYNQSFRTRRLGKTVKAVLIWIYYRHNRQLTFLDTNGFGDYRLENPDALYEIID